MTGTGNWSNVTKSVNSTVGSTIRWQVYANDTVGNMNASLIYSFDTINPPPIITSGDIWKRFSKGKICIFIIVKQFEIPATNFKLCNLLDITIHELFEMDYYMKEFPNKDEAQTFLKQFYDDQILLYACLYIDGRYEEENC